MIDRGIFIIAITMCVIFPNDSQYFIAGFFVLVMATFLFTYLDLMMAKNKKMIDSALFKATVIYSIMIGYLFLNENYLVISIIALLFVVLVSYARGDELVVRFLNKWF